MSEWIYHVYIQFREEKRWFKAHDSFIVTMGNWRGDCESQTLIIFFVCFLSLATSSHIPIGSKFLSEADDGKTKVKDDVMAGPAEKHLLFEL